MIYDGTLLESVEALGDPPLVKCSGEIWHRLQGEKTAVIENLLDEASLRHTQVNAEPDADASEAVPRELEWIHRSQLESRLREIGEAQDRLIEGSYGQCIECAREIDARRLAADPAAARCLTCQSIIDNELSVIH